MSERFRKSIRAFRKHATEIETAGGVVGLAGMAAVAIDPEAAREASEFSPVGIDAVANAGNELGLSDQAVFAVITIFFGVVTAHGIYGLRRRKSKGA